MNEKPIIITDVDDVICEGGYLHVLNNYLGTSYSKEDFKGFNYFEDIIEDPLEKKYLSNIYASKIRIIIQL